MPPFQQEIVERVYGARDADRNRTIRTVFIFIPRGNGKTTFTAALSLLHLLGPERDPAGQVIDAAADREQASIAFDAAARMIRMSPALRKRCRIVDSVKTIHHLESGSRLKAISRDSRTKHGMNVSFLSADEIHAWRDRDLWDVLRTSMGKRKNPLTVVTTTAGHGTEHWSYELLEYARKVKADPLIDPTFLPILFEAPKDCDPFDEEVWHAVNPALAAGFAEIDHLRNMAREARESPAALRVFKQLHLNIWQDGLADPWLDLDVWDEGATEFDLEALEGLPCWIGIDLSATTDLTAVIAVWKGEGHYFMHPWFFCPEDGIARRERKDQAPYRAWAAENYLTPTPGAVIDYDIVEAKILELCKRFDVREVGLDPWNAAGTINRLMRQNVPCVEVRQGYATMSPLTKESEAVILSRNLAHTGHPVMRWMMGNVRMDTDPAGNVKPAKNKSTDRIDGVVAMIMALGRAEMSAGYRSVLEDISWEELLV